MPDSQSHSVPSLYVDDTEIYASSDNCAGKVNLDLENYVNGDNELQITPVNACKHILIGSFYNFKNKIYDGNQPKGCWSQRESLCIYPCQRKPWCIIGISYIRIYHSRL